MTEVNSQTQRSPSGFPSSALQVRKDVNELLAEEGSGLGWTRALGEHVLVQRTHDRGS